MIEIFSFQKILLRLFLSMKSMLLLQNVSMLKLAVCVYSCVFLVCNFVLLADREVQRILLELLNQMDGFDQSVNVKVCRDLLVRTMKRFFCNLGYHGNKSC
jgi:hypothetical protein